MGEGWVAASWYSGKPSERGKIEDRRRKTEVEKGKSQTKVALTKSLSPKEESL